MLVSVCGLRPVCRESSDRPPSCVRQLPRSACRLRSSLPVRAGRANIPWLSCWRRPWRACSARSPMVLPDFCGVCSNCTRIALSMPLAERVGEAVAAREELREVDKKDTRVLIQTHPDVVVIPPDPPQLLIKLGQVRSVIQRIYRLPADAPRAVYIFTSTAFMKEAANSLLKILEEPPAYAHIFLLAENPGELLPTIRSRAEYLSARRASAGTDRGGSCRATQRLEAKPARAGGTAGPGRSRSGIGFRSGRLSRQPSGCAGDAGKRHQ